MVQPKNSGYPDDLTRAIVNAKTVLSEFCTEESIQKIIENTFHEQELSEKMFPGKPRSFYELVFARGLYDRFIRARYISVEINKYEQFFFGYDPKTDDFIDTRKDPNSISFVRMIDWTDDQILSRLKIIYGEKGDKHDK